MKTIWFLIVFKSSALLPCQIGLNAKLGKSIGSPCYSSLICFTVGALAMLLYIPFSKESISWAGAKSFSFISLLGGGRAQTFGLIVGEQVIVTVLLDHFNLLFAQQNTSTFGAYWLNNIYPNQLVSLNKHQAQ
jgi:transporter family-2 protein